MSYELQVDETLPDGLRRVALEQMDEALAYLSAPEGDLDTAVHESRKCFKRLRAVLRLVRPAIGKGVYRQENKWFRDAGRLLADLRDGVVMIRTLDGVLEENAGLGDPEDYAALRQDLVQAYQAARRAAEEAGALAKASAMVGEARQRATAWPIEEESFTAVAGGLRRIYRRGRKRLAEAQAEPTAESLHEWRKRVKDLWYSATLLYPANPNEMASLVEETDALSDILGDEHDLAGLQAQLSTGGTPPALVARIGQKRAVLQAQAFPLGQPVYAESPKAFTRRLRAYWEARRL